MTRLGRPAPHWCLVGALVVATTAEAAPAAPPAPVDLRAVLEDLGPDGAMWYQHVQTLSNPWFEGRADGSDGIERARAYAAFHFEQTGLTPAFTTDATPSWRQPFTFGGDRIVRITVHEAGVHLDGRALERGTDFAVLGASASGTVSGAVAYVGYAIAESPDGAYTSFPDGAAELDGRIALMLRYEPVDDEGWSRWAAVRAPGNFSPMASLERKLRTVVHHGAIGVLLVAPPGVAGVREGFESLDGYRMLGPDYGVPVVQVAPAIAAELLARARNDGRSLLAWRRAADADSDGPVPLGDARVDLNVDIDRRAGRDQIPAANLGAILPGSGARADEWLVISAHYDHNGYGNFGTEPEDGPLFPGADDNASGTAGVLVLARRLAQWAQDDPRPRRSILFLLFDAEERGLFGSAHWTTHPSVDADRVMACLNLDMIGRVRHDRITVLGAATAREFPELLRRLDIDNPLHVVPIAAGSGASDDANFHGIGIPALHFFSGLHAEYTTPRDFGWTVNPVGARHVLDLAEALAKELATRGEPLTPTVP